MLIVRQKKATNNNVIYITVVKTEQMLTLTCSLDKSKYLTTKMCNYGIRPLGHDLLRHFFYSCQLWLERVVPHKVNDMLTEGSEVPIPSPANC